MKYIVLSICFSIFFSSVSFGQMGLHHKALEEEAETIKSLPLLVVLRDTNKNEATNQFNENLKEAIETTWSYSPISKYITIEEWREMSKDNDQKDNYAILHFTEKTLQANAPANCLAIGLLKNKILTHYAYLPTHNPADMVVALSTLQSDLKMGKLKGKEKKEYVSEVSKRLQSTIGSKTLLIDESMISNDLEKSIGEIYPHQYQIVSKDVIDDAILNYNPDYYYLRTAHILARPMTTDKTDSTTGARTIKTEEKGAALLYIYDAADNSPLIFLRPGEKVNKKAIETLIGYLE